MRFEPTYKELKLFCLKSSIFCCACFEPTYKELKLKLSPSSIGLEYPF